MDFQRSGYNGTYEYYDQRTGSPETPLGAIGVAANGVVFFNPSAGAGEILRLDSNGMHILKGRQ